MWSLVMGFVLLCLCKLLVTSVVVAVEKYMYYTARASFLRRPERATDAAEHSSDIMLGGGRIKSTSPSESNHRSIVEENRSAYGPGS